MTIPNVPTDNLYKFLALTGVFLTLLSIFYPEIKRQELLDEITVLNGQIKKIEYESKPLEDQTKGIKKKIDELDKVCNCGFKSIITDSIIIRPSVRQANEQIDKLQKEIDELINERNELTREISLKAIEINTKHELVDNKKTNWNDINEAANFFGPFGLLLSSLGFILWFAKTQHYQDNLLRGQYEEYLKYERCQSCGLKLSTDFQYQKLSKDERHRTKFCSECYIDNNFTEPEITLTEMKSKIRQRCKDLGFGKLSTLIYLSRLDELERWRKKFSWK